MVKYFHSDRQSKYENMNSDWNQRKKNYTALWRKGGKKSLFQNLYSLPTNTTDLGTEHVLQYSHLVGSYWRNGFSVKTGICSLQGK